jgi:predicted Zn-dependent protease
LEAGELVARTKELAREQQRDALLLLNRELPPGEFPVILLAEFTHSLVADENFYLYLVSAYGPMARE